MEIEFNFDPAKLKFFEEGHRYTYNDRPLPSVTEVLRATGFIDDRFWHSDARLHGQYVHMACCMINEGTLEWSSLSDLLLPYAKAYQRFLEETGFKPLLFEQPVCHEVYGYAGTLDVVGELNGKLVLPDIKSGGVDLSVRLQTAAYGACLKVPVVRHALQLTDEGKYFLSKPFTDRNEARIFYGLAAAVNWRMRWKQ